MRLIVLIFLLVLPIKGWCVISTFEPTVGGTITYHDNVVVDGVYVGPNLTVGRDRFLGANLDYKGIVEFDLRNFPVPKSNLDSIQSVILVFVYNGGSVAGTTDLSARISTYPGDGKITENDTFFDTFSFANVPLANPNNFDHGISPYGFTIDITAELKYAFSFNQRYMAFSIAPDGMLLDGDNLTFNYKLPIMMITSIPEPRTLSLLLAGFTMLAVAIKKRRY